MKQARIISLVGVVLVGLVGLGAATNKDKNNTDRKKPKATQTAATASHSTTIALTSNERNVVFVNRGADGVSIHQVEDRRGYDPRYQLGDVDAGEQPRCVANHPDARGAYVTNRTSGTVSVVDLKQREVVATIEDVGT